MTATCNHQWEPLHGWVGRYRCAACFVVGYKQRLTTGFGSTEVVPYRCTATKNGKACGALVIYSHADEGTRLCPEHEAKRRTKKARKR